MCGDIAGYPAAQRYEGQCAVRPDCPHHKGYLVAVGIQLNHRPAALIFLPRQIQIAHIVFSNAALTEMADKRPRDMNQFLQISGVGYVKAARYGEKNVSGPASQPQYGIFSAGQLQISFRNKKMEDAGTAEVAGRNI